MSDRTARLVHWLADGRSAALVAPALRAATGPGARAALERARAAGELADEIDLERARRIVRRLSDDREFRRSMSVAAGRVQQAVEGSSPRRGRRVLVVLGVLAAVAVAAAAFLRRAPAPGGATAHGHRAPDGAGATPYVGASHDAP